MKLRHPLPIDMIAFSQQLQRFVTLKTDYNGLLQKNSDYYTKCKHILFDVHHDIEHLAELNQPKHQIPERLTHRFPFRYSQILRQFALRVYNLLFAPQRTINASLQTLAVNNINLSQQIMLGQQKQQFENQQQLLSIQQQLTQLAKQLAQLEQQIQQHKK